jgi:gamma-glutamylcyclotransferase (GGCT)/AIG2-like uncharacterized protein YtfP
MRVVMAEVAALIVDRARKVSGTVFAITAEELVHADRYEVDAYRRDRVLLASGIHAWVYVDAGSARGG